MLVASLAVAGTPTLHVEAKGPVRIAASELHGSLERERTFALPLAASHLALHWLGQAAAQVTVAFSVDGRTFGLPIPVGRDEVGEGRADGETYGNLLLAGGARFVRVTSDRPLAHLSILDLDTHGSGQTAIALGSVAAVAAAAAAQPAVISRAGWGANESLRFDATGHELWAPVFQPIQKLIVHHTATQNQDPDPAATVRAIYYYDAVTQGWGDMGYNFLIDEAGRIYEGRYTRIYAPGETPTEEDATGHGVTGAHAVGFNSGTVGIALLGTLTNRDATPAARDALTRLLAWIAGGHGLDPHGSALYVNPVSGTQATFPNIAGHRDVAATECPGGVFYATLPALRDSVAALIVGTPTSDYTISASPAAQTVTAGQQTTYTATVTPSGGFTSAVDLVVSGLPVNAIASWSTNPVAGGGGMSTLTVTTSASTPVGTTALTITGTSGTLTHASTVSLVVKAPPTPDFSLTLSPTTQSVRGGGSVSYRVTVTSSNGFAGAISMSVTGLPSGSSGSFSPTSVMPGATSVLTIRTAATPRGTFTFTVRGTNGSLSRTATGTLQVTKR
jgi:N-acetylmuramoyl-L-alanine amidase.